MKKTFRIPLALFLLIGYLNFAQEIVPYTGYDSIIAYAAERQQNGEYEKAILTLQGDVFFFGLLIVFHQQE